MSKRRKNQRQRRAKKFQRTANGFETIEERALRLAKRREKHESNLGGTNIHHRHTKHTGGGNNPENLSRVPIREHHAFNVLFNDGHMPPPEIARKFSRVWLRPDWEVVARKKGHQCVTPCGGAKPCNEEPTPSAKVASEYESKESGPHLQSESSTLSMLEKSMSLLETALNVIHAQARN